MDILLVFIGGGLGSLLRYGITILLQKYQLHFPVATLLANVLSCFIIGILVGLQLRQQLPNHYKLLLATGICGGFSTFSTFSNETLQLFLSGNIVYALVNIVISLLSCLAAVYVGIVLPR